ncbi:hypothetical protein J1N35_037199 [Gossypium stocksii]|uniref:Uncharacterized protein n=1 Tax=Gossypium stocksii TaxID=47602 RepID=A0A9D3ZLM6_9ROSI|nr:hypothetical protein J1N35_037199 [Gossypium stocksii]
MQQRIDARLKDFQEAIKTEVHFRVRSELHSELHSFFEQCFGQTSPTTVTRLVFNKENGTLGESPLRFPPKKHLVMSPMSDLRHIGVFSRAGSLDAGSTFFEWIVQILIGVISKVGGLSLNSTSKLRGWEIM